LDDNATLTDPKIHAVGKEQVVGVAKGIFGSCTSLSFKAKNIFVDGNVGIIGMS
jgi:hypothetical protein